MKATKRVLVIDDDPVVGKSFDRVLAAKGYAVITATSGEEALDRLAREDYDVVYTDIRMPGLDGMEVARRVRASRPWLPVVIITGYGTPANESEAKTLGVEAFLHKPLSPEVIEDSAQVLAFEREAGPAPATAPSQAAAATVRAPIERKGLLGFLRNLGLFFLAPFVALAYVLIGPFVGLAALAWFGWRALTGRAEPRSH